MELLDALHHRERLVQEIVVDKENAVMSIKQAHQALDEALKNAKTKGQILAVKKDLRTIVDRIYVLTDYLDQVTYQTQGYMRLEVSTISLSELLHDVLKIFNAQYNLPAQQILFQQNTMCETVQADREKLEQLLVDGLCYAQRRKQEDGPILLCIEETSLGYPINAIPGHVKKVRALCFGITTAVAMPSLSTLYMVSIDRGTIHLPQDTTELPIMHNQQVTEAHYGAFEFMDTSDGTTQIYVIPIRLREVRPQAMDLLERPEKKVFPESTIDSAEVAFMQAVQEKTKIDVQFLERAIRLIKRYYAGVTILLS